MTFLKKGRGCVPFSLSVFFANRGIRKEHLFLHDSKITIRGVSALFAQERCEDWQAEKSGDVFFEDGGGET
jgi:hypothetical protein